MEFQIWFWKIFAGNNSETKIKIIKAANKDRQLKENILLMRIGNGENDNL